MRCLTLADAMTENGWECIFWISLETLKFIPRLSTSAYQIVTAPDTPRQFVDMLVVDHYEIGAEFEKECRTWAQRIFIIDDITRQHDCDFLLDQTYGRHKEDYKLLTPETCSILSGSSYALLKPSFLERRKYSLERRKNSGYSVGRVLLFLSMGNFSDLYILFLRALEHIEKPLQIDIIVNNTDYVRDLTEGKDFHHKVTIHESVSDMAEVMAYADIAIGGGGATNWERCCLGLPSIITVLAENQRDIAQKLHEAGAVYDLGWYESIDFYDFANSLKAFIDNPRDVEKMSQNAASICDGLGVQRVLEAING